MCVQSHFAVFSLRTLIFIIVSSITFYTQNHKELIIQQYLDNGNVQQLVPYIDRCVDSLLRSCFDVLSLSPLFESTKLTVADCFYSQHDNNIYQQLRINTLNFSSLRNFEDIFNTLILILLTQIKQKFFGFKFLALLSLILIIFL